MKPDVDSCVSANPEIDERLVREHLGRLGPSYFQVFQEQEVYRHLRCLGRLSPERPADTIVRRMEDGTVECTVLAFDYPSEFSLITGILSGMGVNILSGDVFTYEKAPSSALPVGSGSKSVALSKDPLRRRRIIDRFTGTLDGDIPFEGWEELFRREIEAVIALLERGDEASEKTAKERVNELVARRLARLQLRTRDLLYPVDMEIDNSAGAGTRLKVVSEDAPAFLYAFSTSLSIQNILIEHVKIRTVRGKIEDRIDLVDGSGRKIEEEDRLDRLKISVLLTKQFTYFLGRAPDPISALSRFEHLLREIFQQPGKGKWIELLTSPETLQSLARLLGASDFLWEDFVRIQYESILPMLHERRRGSEGIAEALDRRLPAALEGASTFEEQKQRLNEFKDREIYLIDLDQILDPAVDFRTFAERLTVLAEKVVQTATALVYHHLTRRFGVPTTVGGLEARLAVMGLGKLGGAALGYASDIELLFVYSDSGRTNGDTPIENAEFFDRLVRGVIGFIRAKREGIFHVDVRLRPFGSAGPLASSLETFCSYYGRGGQAHSYERLALVRMRAIGGDREFGERLERLRDEMVYSSGSIDLRELQEIRERQVAEHTRGAQRPNAKFSKGGLVDVEYGVQILQVLHGARCPEIRTPRIHQALGALHHLEILAPEEVIRLTRAYDFLRQLINGLRMLRGSARDLFLPDGDSEEFAYLARRMGYERGAPLTPAEQLRVDLETHTAAVRVFAERYLGREGSTGNTGSTVADLVLSDEPRPAGAARILEGAGFRELEKALSNLRGLAGQGIRRNTFARLSLLAADVLGRVPDPDMALNNWERLVRAQGSAEFQYNLLLSQPMRLEILLSILAGSQFLSDTLIRNPVFLDWVTIPETLHRERGKEEMEGDLRELGQGARTRGGWLNRLRRLRRREILRIGTRDMCLKVSPQSVMQELTSLAEASVSACLDRVWGDLQNERPGREQEGRFCVLAFGKLGGRELNYSSDIDLLGIRDDGPEMERELFARVMETLRADLTTHTEEGYAYRVDLRLRPFGRSGELVLPFSALTRYYEGSASLWEIQALLKIRPVAGNLALGHRFLTAIRPLLLERREEQRVVNSIETMRNRAIQGTLKPGSPTDVKSGTGGIRDVEFMVQGLQLIHAPGNPSLLEGNTLLAIDLLSEARILDRPAAEQLKRDYLFLRRVEHCLQILDDRQIHALPREPEQVAALAKRVMGVGSNPGRFMTELADCLARVRRVYHLSLNIDH